MAMSPLAQRLQDKTKTDLRSFREENVNWFSNNVSEHSMYGGSLIDIFWQNEQLHLEQKIAEYFEWIEREAQTVSPASLRLDSVNQCVGAVVSYGRQVRMIASDLNARRQGLNEALDMGNWHDVNDTYIVHRGARLSIAMGLGSEAQWSERLNHLSKDNPWFFNMLSVLAIAISIAAFFRSLWQ
jgi:hypothetical protein